jgi:hypothetical protein
MGLSGVVLCLGLPTDRVCRAVVLRTFEIYSSMTMKDPTGSTRGVFLGGHFREGHSRESPSYESYISW